MIVFEADSVIVVGVPLPKTYLADVRLITQVEEWATKANVISFYAATDLVSIGRDKIVRFAKYLRPHAKYCLFIDADVVPRRKTLDRLISHDKDIIAGIVPIVQKGELVWNVTRRESASTFLAVKPNELPDNPFKANSFGFGIVLVKTKVFEKLQWPFFQDEVEFANKRVGEDIYFCRKAKSAGFDLWVDPKVKCDHIRTVSLGSLVNKKLKGDKQ